MRLNNMSSLHGPAVTKLAEVRRTLSETMAELKDRLRAILDTFDRNTRIIYVDYPVHRNVGDLLIHMGTEQFFRDYGLQSTRPIAVLTFPRFRLPGCNEKTTILCHGGGNFGDIYCSNQHLRERILETYPDCRLIFLPQTVHFGSQHMLLASMKRFISHGNAHIFVRDSYSEDLLRASGMTHISLMPDMAHQLWGNLKPTGTSRHSEPLCLFRRDIEKTGERITPCCGQTLDWDDIIKRSQRHLRQGD